MKNLTLLFIIITLTGCSLTTKPSEPVVNLGSINSGSVTSETIATDQASTGEDHALSGKNITSSSQAKPVNQECYNSLGEKTTIKEKWNQYYKQLSTDNTLSEKDIIDYVNAINLNICSTDIALTDERGDKENIVRFKGSEIGFQSYSGSGDNQLDGWIRVDTKKKNPAFLQKISSCETKQDQFEDYLSCRGRVPHSIDKISPNIKYITFVVGGFEEYDTSSFWLYSIDEDKVILEWQTYGYNSDNDRSTKGDRFGFISSNKDNSLKLNIIKKDKFPLFDSIELKAGNYQLFMDDSFAYLLEYSSQGDISNKKVFKYDLNTLKQVDL